LTWVVRVLGALALGVDVLVGVTVTVGAVNWNVMAFGTDTLVGAVVALTSFVGELAGGIADAVIAVAVAVSVAVGKAVEVGG
jgi:hypothetical protein